MNFTVRSLFFFIFYFFIMKKIIEKSVLKQKSSGRPAKIKTESFRLRGWGRSVCHSGAGLPVLEFLKN
jgi:hypothetical protein